MNIPVEIVAIFLTAILAMQGWTMVEVVKLRTKVALLTQRVFHRGPKSEEEEE